MVNPGAASFMLCINMIEESGVTRQIVRIDIMAKQISYIFFIFYFFASHIISIGVH